MKNQDYTATITVAATPQAVFKNINDVTKWWTNDLEGNSQKPGDEFTVHFGEIHVSTQQLIELIPDKKVVWLVTESKLNFIKQADEWTGTTIIFDLIENENKTQLQFTHLGLNPEIECFDSCTKGWDYFIKGSLFKLLTEGNGTPGLIK